MLSLVTSPQPQGAAGLPECKESWEQLVPQSLINARIGAAAGAGGSLPSAAASHAEDDAPKAAGPEALDEYSRYRGGSLPRKESSAFSSSTRIFSESNLPPTVLSDEDDGISEDETEETFASAAAEQQMMFDFEEQRPSLATMSMEVELKERPSSSSHSQLSGVRVISHAAAASTTASSVPGSATKDRRPSRVVEEGGTSELQAEQQAAQDDLASATAATAAETASIRLVPSSPEVDLRRRQDKFLAGGICACLVEVGHDMS
jgi:hypothetical protein